MAPQVREILARGARRLRIPWPGGGGGRRSARPRLLEVRARTRATADQRVRVLGGLVLAGFAFVAIRSGILMLVPNERLEDKATGQFLVVDTLEASRGDLRDRDGGLLATTVEMPSLRADPQRIPADRAPEIAARLSEILGIEPATVKAALTRTVGGKPARDVLIARNLDPGLAERARQVHTDGLFVRNEGRRYYPGGSMAAGLLGIAGRSGAGLDGLEGAPDLDTWLRGDTFHYLQLRDAQGHGLTTRSAALADARRGNDVYLTIDRAIQLASEQAIDRIQVDSAPEAATIVVVDVHTGEVLAVANRPDTNPNDPSTLDLAGLRNHAVADAFEPGSVFKPFVIALALEDGLVTPGTQVDCEGGRWSVGASTIRDDHPHGVLTVDEVIKYSSNIGAAKITLRLGAEKAVAGLKDFGFGRPLRLGLPSEVSGFVRRPDRIRTIELATTAFGQGVTATPLHLALAVAALANGGVRMHPLLVKEVRNRQGEVLFANAPQEDRRVVGERAARETLEAMVQVTEPGGTGTRARVPGYRVAGKTGTAQKVVDGVYSPTARVSSFIGAVPADDPQVAIAVVVDTPTQGSRYGGIAAAPAFAHVAAAALRRRGVPANPAYPEPPCDPALASAPEPPPPVPLQWPCTPDEPVALLQWADRSALRVPDLEGLSKRDVLVVFQDSSLEVALWGHGLAVSQQPAAGSVVPPGARVEVRFQ
ncbi:MAG: transpeptidase family protein [Deltaproteobacteria bacterium]|nr:transpeptidase family protein [Deltaproteobacteria bacterium]